MHKPLQELDQIHADDAHKKSTLEYVMSKQKHQSKKPVYATAFALCCILFMVSWLLPKNSAVNTPSTFVATVTLDINPSIELKLNESMQVIDIVAYNDDAKRILDQLSLKDKEIEEALTDLMQEQAYAEYLQDGILEIGVYAKDDQITENLESTILQYLDTKMDTSQYHCARIDEKTFANAEQHHTSAGKYRVIEQILQYDTNNVLEDLNRMSMKELYALLEKFDISAVPENCQSEKSEHGKRGQGNGHHGESHK